MPPGHGGGGCCCCCCCGGGGGGGGGGLCQLFLLTWRTFSMNMLG